jgi:HEAT repeat protein
MKKKTADELMAELSLNPEFVERQNAMERRRHEAARLARLALEPIINDLNKLGISVSSLTELPALSVTDDRYIPILLDWLPRTPDVDIKEGIVRALTVPQARRVAAPTLIREFLRAPSGESALKWAIGNALAVLSDEAVLSDVINILRDRTHGSSREMFAVSLGNMKTQKAVELAVETLLELLDDPDLTGHAIMALGKLKAAVALPALERLLNHPKAWVRKEAASAIRKIRKGTGG